MLALADAGDTGKAEAGQRVGHRLSLRVEDLGLRHDVDDDSGHDRLLQGRRAGGTAEAYLSWVFINFTGVGRPTFTGNHPIVRRWSGEGFC
ncbi:hypothetical protein GCM10010185_63380 [Saccharothrix coeruleofusca]|uniref:Uncharacterized protein n=1 Tax=Saccharothrix coeruleofusca TaxID=33919 RepID=A0A918EI08_9PSEU|nr:hypothetical protein GCM10010185_63380 [Saccharothrix coeruleofusca]